MEVFKWFQNQQMIQNLPQTSENKKETPKLKFCIDEILREPLKPKQVPYLVPKTCKSSSSDPKSPKKYKCSLCCKSFDRRWLLHGHIRTHTGEKPYKCDICHKKFADKSNLRAHVQTHSGIKRYKCQRCGRGFTLRSYLNKHLEARCQPEVPGFSLQNPLFSNFL